MITGDNPLTACQVGRELKIATKPLSILECNDNHDIDDSNTDNNIHNTVSKSSDKGRKWDSTKFHWKIMSVSIGQLPVIAEQFDLKTVSKLAEKFDFCLYGDSLSMVLSLPSPIQILKHTKVVARSSPEQKVSVLTFRPAKITRPRSCPS